MRRIHLVALVIVLGILVSSTFVQASASACLTQVCIYLPLIYAPTTVPVTLLPSGDFEPPLLWEGNPYDFTAGGPSNPGMPPPHSGHGYAWIRDVGIYQAGIGQDIIIPPSTPFLSYWYIIQSTEPTCGADRGMIKIWRYPGSVPVTVDQFDLCAATQTHTWTNRVVDLRAFNDTGGELWFLAESSNGLSNSNWFIDDVGLRERGQ